MIRLERGMEGGVWRGLSVQSECVNPQAEVTSIHSLDLMEALEHDG